MTPGGGRKNRVLSRKRGAHHTEEALAVKPTVTRGRRAWLPAAPSGMLKRRCTRQKPHDAARLRRARHQRDHRHRHLPPPRESLSQRRRLFLGRLARDRRRLPPGRALLLRGRGPRRPQRRSLPLRARRLRPLVGVGVGWMALAANLFAYGAVARGFGRNLSFLVPALNRAGPQIALAVRGDRRARQPELFRHPPGALTSDFFSARQADPHPALRRPGPLLRRLAPPLAPPPAGRRSSKPSSSADFAALFACTGFEYVPVTAGETETPGATSRSRSSSPCSSRFCSTWWCRWCSWAPTRTRAARTSRWRKRRRVRRCLGGRIRRRRIGDLLLRLPDGGRAGHAPLSLRAGRERRVSGDLRPHHPRFRTPAVAIPPPRSSARAGDLRGLRPALRLEQCGGLRPVRPHLPGGAGASAHPGPERVYLPLGPTIPLSPPSVASCSSTGSSTTTPSSRSERSPSDWRSTASSASTAAAARPRRSGVDARPRPRRRSRASRGEPVLFRPASGSDGLLGVEGARPARAIPRNRSSSRSAWTSVQADPRRPAQRGRARVAHGRLGAARRSA